MGWRGLVSVNSTVGSVSSSSLLWGLVDLDVGNLQLSNIQTLSLSVGLSVLQQVLDVVDRLGRPSSLLNTPLLTLSSSTDGVSESSERNGSLVVQNILQVLLSSLQVPTVDGLGSLSGVLERDSQVGTASGGTLGRVDWGSSVTNHFVLEKKSKRLREVEIFFLYGRARAVRYCARCEGCEKP